MTAPLSKLEAHLQADIADIIAELPDRQHGQLIQQILETLVRMIGREADRLDWKILSHALLDMEQGFQIFYPYRHIRKITLFGSARTPATQPDYQMAMEFARRLADQGFMVMTGAGAGIMQAGNEGAGPERSFGLNIQLPFEQGANPVMAADPKLIDFKYFFTRKLFFLRESDAIALFPGGFGTQDEAFESLTLIQTGKAGPMPIVLIDHPGGDYWKGWDSYIRDHLLERGLVSPDDPSLYTVTNDLDQACEAIVSFYRVFHSSRYVDGQLIIRLTSPLSGGAVDQLNVEFGDILSQGKIEAISTLAAEQGDETEHLPRLALHFNNRDFGRLHQFIQRINQLGVDCPEVEHPEHK
ncbi:LOG family protein [Romeria aff. gracilis LEGE 07310]|uniref:LOG family protein n=1 Tax=Vasconcelosia minhoensis LEGE 07310 TaxID=915328 RepID=A0A8J7DM90_9CYAN|nr:LOG family protein [Romeria gracilis]MBE9076145.1 LOG family protein [Romeria aff. gracilis LEGE 07310]